MVTLLLPLVLAGEDPVAEAMKTLYASAANSTVAYDRLEELCTVYGHRMVGTERLERAIDWAAETMREDGLAVSEQAVDVSEWVRGDERVRMTAPEERELRALGLGMNVGGPAKGEVVVLGSLDELETVDVAGKIVLFDNVWEGYGATVQVRTKGPPAAAAKGAVGVLIRSVTSTSLHTPHTGTTSWGEDVVTVPAAAITVEDAYWIRGLVARGETVTVDMKLGAKLKGRTTSRNVIAEVEGREQPDEVVVVGCHIDSWDVGQGAQDDGAGCLIAWEAVRLMKETGLVPRRSVRAVLYTSEENGESGGNTYLAEADVGAHVAAIESDSGNGRADGFRVQLDLPDAERLAAQGALWELQPALEAIGGDRLRPGYSGADIGMLGEAGVPAFGLGHDTSSYWPIHHTEADTFDKIVLEDLQHNVGLMAAMAYALAEREDRLAPAVDRVDVDR